MVLVLVLDSALAGEIVLRNDTNKTDTYESPDQIVHMTFPECAISVLTPEIEDLPLDIGELQLLFATGTGASLGDLVYAEIGLELVTTGGAPTGSYDWGPELFGLTVSNDALNQILLNDPYKGFYPLTIETGSVAVQVCTVDPKTGEAWPNDAGMMIDWQSPSEGTWIYTDDTYYEWSDLGYPGSWIIRAISDSGSGGTDDGGGDTSGGDDSSGDDGGGGDGGVDPGGLQVDSVVPNSTLEGTAEDVAVIGAGFEAGADVYFGGLPGSNPTVSGDTTIQVNAPTALPPGIHDVMVELSDGRSVTLSSAFTVIAAEEAPEEDTGTEEEGCGCAAGTRSGGWGVLALGLIALGRRRRG